MRIKHSFSNLPRQLIVSLVAVFLTTATLSIKAAETAIDSIIAVVNDDIILSSEFTRERNTMIAQNQPGLPTGEELDKLVVERLILQSIQLQEAARRNIKVDESSLQRALEEMASNNNVTLTQLRDSVTKEGLDFLEFREDLRKNLTISRLTRREIETNLFVSDAEVEELLSTEASRQGEFLYTLEHILVKLPEQARLTQPDRYAVAICRRNERPSGERCNRTIAKCCGLPHP